MWIIIKIKKLKEKSILKKSLIDFLGSDLELYSPKIFVEKNDKNKIIKKDFFILGNYLLVKHKKFVNESMISRIKYLRGLDYILPGFKNSQIEIEKFIDRCKTHEDGSGYLMQEFFKFVLGEKLRFNSGPFTNFISEIVRIQKNKIKVLVGNYTLSINKKSNCLLTTI